MSTHIFWEPDPPDQQHSSFIVTLDACMAQSHEESNEVTQHPIELGAKISDHAFKNPDELKLEGIISNTPLKYLFDTLTMDSDYALQQYEKLRDLMDKRYIATVLTSLWSYDSMILYNLSAPRTAANGNSILVNLSFRRIEIVASATVAAPDSSIPGGQPKKEMGSQATKAVSAKIETKSLLLQALQALTLVN
jgi:hypothetical protein